MAVALALVSPHSQRSAVSQISWPVALVLANAEEEGRDQFYKRLLTFGAVVVAVAPLVTRLVLVAPGWL